MVSLNLSLSLSRVPGPIMDRSNPNKEGNASLICSSVAIHLYRRFGSEAVRSRVRRLVIRMEGGPARSVTIREILRQLYGVNIGLHTRWPHKMKPAVFHPGTNFGRYSCIADTVRTFTRNHPLNTRSTHAFFYNSALGKVKGGPIQFNNLEIGNGVWIGHNAIILPPTERIGDGAVITAGSVVCSNVPPYAIVTGFPARVVGHRFSKETIAELLASRWWERSPEELAGSTALMGHPLRGELDSARPESMPGTITTQAAVENEVKQILSRLRCLTEGEIVSRGINELSKSN